MVYSGLPLAKGHQVLLLWGSSSQPESVKTLVSSITEQIGVEGRVQVENVEMLVMSQHAASTFDIAMSGYASPASTVHSADILAELARIVKPGGSICLREATSSSGKLKTPEKLQSALKLAGCIDVALPQTVPLSPEEMTGLKSSLGVDGDIVLMQIQGKKPDYEVGASTQLKISFAKKPADNVQQVWSLSSNDMMEDDMDLINSDDLLDDDDLKKPDPSSLKADCGGEPKKKKVPTATLR